MTRHYPADNTTDRLWQVPMPRRSPSLRWPIAWVQQQCALLPSGQARVRHYPERLPQAWHAPAHRLPTDRRLRAFAKPPI